MDLAGQQLLLKATIENAVDGVILIDSTGIIRLVNPAASHLFKYPADEMLHKNVSLLMGTPHHLQHDGYIQKYLTTGKKNIIGIGREVEGKKKDGTSFSFWLSISEIKLNDDTWFTGFVHDLTEKKAAEQKLLNYTHNLEREVKERTAEISETNKELTAEIERRRLVESELRASQSLYREIARNFPNGVINVFDKNLNYVFADGRGLIEAGIWPEDLVGTSYLSRLNKETAVVVEKELNSVLQGHSRSFEIKSGGNYYFLRAVPLYAGNNVVQQVLVVETNITPQKHAEEEIFRSLQKEKELNELKSRFVSMASHEFRTPLSTILSSATLISKYTTTEQEALRQKHTERIKSNVNNLNIILQDFLSLEKLDAGVTSFNPETFNLCVFLQEQIEEIEGILKAGQHIQLKSENPDVEIYADKHLLRNIMNNLLSNASKYSDAGKSIDVSINQSEKSCTVAVKDYGMGIPLADQPKLFSRFFRAGNSGNISGTGLGLHIVKKYVELMQGTISFQSEPGKGSTFLVNFIKQANG